MKGFLSLKAQFRQTDLQPAIFLFFFFFFLNRIFLDYLLAYFYTLP